MREAMMTRMLALVLGFVAIAVLGGCVMESSSSEEEQSSCATSETGQELVAAAACAVTSGGGSGTTTGGGFLSSCASARLEAVLAALSACQGTTKCGGTCEEATHKCVVAPAGTTTTNPFLGGCDATFTYRCDCDCKPGTTTAEPIDISSKPL
jgi:hypothetical protein